MQLFIQNTLFFLIYVYMFVIYYYILMSDLIYKIKKTRCSLKCLLRLCFSGFEFALCYCYANFSRNELFYMNVVCRSADSLFTIF